MKYNENSGGPAGVPAPSSGHENPEAFSELETHLLATLFARIRSEKLRVAVLRNYESLPEKVGSRDIDFVVRPDDRDKAEQLVQTVAVACGCKIARYYRDDMFSSLTLMRRGMSGDLFTLSVDFFCGRRVYGIEILAASDMVQILRDHRGVPVVREPFVFLDKWVYLLVVGQKTPPKYDRVFADLVASHGDEIAKRLPPILGGADVQHRLDMVRKGRSSHSAALSPRERLGVLWRLARRKPVSSLVGIARFIGYRLRDTLAPKGIFLSISGPDGSGKTTVINQVIDQLGAVYVADKVQYHHFRPSIMPRIGELAKKSRVVSSVDTDYDRPHRAKPSAFFGSLVRILYYWLDYLIGYIRLIRPALVRRDVVLFDRYFFDMIADSGRSRIALPKLLLRALGRLLPLPRHAFFISVEADEIFRRKQELALGQIKTLNNNYSELAELGWLTLIENNGAPEQAAQAIVDQILIAHAPKRFK